MVESCYRTSKTLINPIIDWSDEDVWELIKTEHIPYCGMYDEGCKRLGCIGCPMATLRERIWQFERYPKYKDAYIRAFDKMLDVRKEKNLNNKLEEWKDGEGVFRWWLYRKGKQKTPLFEEWEG